MLILENFLREKDLWNDYIKNIDYNEKEMMSSIWPKDYLNGDFIDGAIQIEWLKLLLKYDNKATFSFLTANYEIFDWLFDAVERRSCERILVDDADADADLWFMNDILYRRSASAYALEIADVSIIDERLEWYRKKIQELENFKKKVTNKNK